MKSHPDKAKTSSSHFLLNMTHYTALLYPNFICSLDHHRQGPWIGSSPRCTISASELSPLPLSQSWVMMWQHVIGRLMSNVSCNIHFPLKWTKKSISHLETSSRSYTSRVIVQNWMGLKFKVAFKSFSFDCSSGHAALWEAKGASYWWELGMSFVSSLTPSRSPFLLWQDAPETSREESWAREVGRSVLQGQPYHFFLCEPQFPHLWNRFIRWTSLVVRWWGLHASTAKGTGSIPGWGAEILHAVRCSQKQKEISQKTWNRVNKNDYCHPHFAEIRK